MKLPDEGGKHMRVFRVIVVVWTIKVGGHRGNPPVAVLATHCLNVQNPRNFGDSIGLIGWFQRSGEESRFLNGLGCKLWVDARRPKKKKSFNTSTVGGIHQVDLYLQVVAQKISGVGVVCMDSPHLRGGIDHDIRRKALQGLQGGTSVGEIELGRGEANQICVAGFFEMAPNRRTGEASMARDVDLIRMLHGVLAPGEHSLA